MVHYAEPNDHPPGVRASRARGGNGSSSAPAGRTSTTCNPSSTRSKPRKAWQRISWLGANIRAPLRTGRRPVLRLHLPWAPPFRSGDACCFSAARNRPTSCFAASTIRASSQSSGLSGCGKSSLVRAGLLPALRRGHLSDAGSRWRVAVVRPGADPLGALARGLDQTLG